MAKAHVIVAVKERKWKAAVVPAVRRIVRSGDNVLSTLKDFSLLQVRDREQFN